EIIPAAGERSSLLPGRDILLRGGFQGLTQVEGRVVFVGYGVTAPERGYDVYAGVEAKGKIVAYFAGAPESFPPEDRAHFGATPTKTANAAAHGAIGTLRLWDDEDEKNGPWSDFVKLVGNIGSFAWLEDGAAHASLPEIRGSAGLGPAA